MDDDALRRALRRVFDRLDADRSGAVSTSELRALVDTLQMQISDDALREMVLEADCDRSGFIEFEELLQAVKTQVASGNSGSLAAFVDETGSVLGLWSDLLGSPFKALSEAVSSSPMSKFFLGADEQADGAHEPTKSKKSSSDGSPTESGATTVSTAHAKGKVATRSGPDTTVSSTSSLATAVDTTSSATEVAAAIEAAAVGAGSQAPDFANDAATHAAVGPNAQYEVEDDAAVAGVMVGSYTYHGPSPSQYLPLYLHDERWAGATTAAGAATRSRSPSPSNAAGRSSFVVSAAPQKFANESIARQFFRAPICSPQFNLTSSASTFGHERGGGGGGGAATAVTSTPSSPNARRPPTAPIARSSRGWAPGGDSVTARLTPRRAWQTLRASLPSAALAKAAASQSRLGMARHTHTTSAPALRPPTSTSASSASSTSTSKLTNAPSNGFVSFDFAKSGSGFAGWREHGALPDRPRGRSSAAADKPSVMGLLNPSFLGPMRRLPVQPGTVSSGTQAFVRAAQGE